MNRTSRILAHPLAGGKAALTDPERPPVQSSIGAATQMIFCSDDFFLALKEISLDELIRWWADEHRPERRRLLDPIIGLKRLSKK